MIPVVVCPTCGASSVNDGPGEKLFVVIVSVRIPHTNDYMENYLVRAHLNGSVTSDSDIAGAFVFQERSAAEVAAVMVGGEVVEVEGKPE